MTQETTNSSNLVTASPETTYVRELDPVKVQQFQERLNEEQNIVLGLLAGGFAALVGAIIWAAITVITDYQVGWMAVGIGFLVGFTMRYFGKGLSKKFGILSAGLSLLSCLAGNVLTVAVIVSQQESMSLFEVLFILLLSPSAIFEALSVTFSPIDLLFYGIALYEGYRFAFRQVSPAEQESLYRMRPMTK